MNITNSTWIYYSLWLNFLIFFYSETGNFRNYVISKFTDIPWYASHRQPMSRHLLIPGLIVGTLLQGYFSRESIDCIFICWFISLSSVFNLAQEYFSYTMATKTVVVRNFFYVIGRTQGFGVFFLQLLAFNASPILFNGVWWDLHS